MDANSLSQLYQVIVKDGRSYLQYLSEAYPWATAQKQPELATLLALAKEEGEAVARIARFLQKNHLNPPRFGAYPSVYTNDNFVALDYVVPILLREATARVAQLEGAVGHVADGDARKLLEGYLETKRRQLAALSEIAADKK
jgi:hypothetical protein